MAVIEKEEVGLQPAVGSYTAAVVREFGQPLVVEQVSPQELAPGQIRVKVEATGLCHTDIHAAHGDWPVKPAPPFVPGHEGIGRSWISRGWAKSVTTAAFIGLSF